MHTKDYSLLHSRQLFLNIGGRFQLRDGAFDVEEVRIVARVGFVGLGFHGAFDVELVIV